MIYGTRCSDATSEAVRIFRLTGNARYVPAIVRGILEQQVPAELLLSSIPATLRSGWPKTWGSIRSR